MALKIRKSKAPPRPFGCPMAACMAVLGGAWAPSVIWKLSGGPRRFGELYSDIPGISPKVLTARLKGARRERCRDPQGAAHLAAVSGVLAIGDRARAPSRDRCHRQGRDAVEGKYERGTTRLCATARWNLSSDIMQLSAW
jgi:hypothetical protein